MSSYRLRRRQHTSSGWIIFPIVFIVMFLIGVYVAPYYLLLRSRAAATIYWDGGGNGTSWNDPLNWNTNVVPVPADDVLIDTAGTVNIVEPITVNSLTLGVAGGTAARILNFAYDAISVGPLTINSGDLVVYPGATITHSIASGNTVVGKININVQVGNANIYGNISSNSVGYPQGYGPGTGQYRYDGTGGGSHAGYGGNGRYGVGGVVSYGDYLLPTTLGSGGGSNGHGVGGKGGGAIKLTVAGILTVNGTISSNGQDATYSDWNHPGGAGAGGSVWINATTLTGSGYIQAKGGNAPDTGQDAGGGGGGRIAIYYTNNTFPVSQILAKGGKPYGWDYGAQKGGAGTLFMKSSVATNGDLILDNEDIDWYQTDRAKVRETPLISGITVDNLTVKRYSEVIQATPITVVSTLNVDTYSIFEHNSTLSSPTINILNGAYFYNQSAANITYTTLNWTGGRIIDNGGIFNVVSNGDPLTIPASSILYANVPRSYASVTVNGTLSHTSNWNTEVYKINYTVSGDMTINSGGSINTNSAGYARAYGPGTGQYRYDGTGGGSHAGYGGNGRYGVGGSITYGDYNAPINLGSGGGSNDHGVGGNGGGAIKLFVTGTLTVNGTISADGGAATYSDWNHPGGAGAGGSIWLNVGTLTGSSAITANGGTAPDTGQDAGGGGGGRIAIFYTNSSYDTNLLSARGGKPAGWDYGAQKGGAGTIFIKPASATNGNMIINNKEIDWYQTDSYKVVNTVLPLNLTVDNLTVTHYSEISYASTLNVINTFLIDQYSYFSLTGTANTNVLSVLNTSYLYNQSTAIINYNTLNWTSGRIVDSGGTMSLVSSGASLTVPATSILEINVPRTFASLIVNGTLSHSANGSTESNKLILTINGNADVNTGGSINVDGKGYSVGYGPGTGGSGYDGAGGAAYGGRGGNGQSRAGSTVTYGDQYAPDRLGSGGGSSPNGGSASGGGAIKLEVGGTLTVAGTIRANGTNNYSDWNHPPGGGSGGSIWLSTNTITGAGSVIANGSGTPDIGRDGGGGGGGRIAIYFVYNTSAFTALTVSGGDAGPSAIDGSVGTIFLGGKTADPLNLKQFKTDVVTAIAQGGATNETSIVATFQVQDGDPTDTLTPQVEIKPIGTNFNNIPTDIGANVQYSGTITTATVPVAGLADGESYHWQARICDTFNDCTNWVSFGNNTEAEADVRIVGNANPNYPTIPGSSYFINGQYTNDLQPTLGFVLTDPNSIDSVKYRINIATDNAFNFMVVDFTSNLAAQGTQMFTVGQTDNSGIYNAGGAGQELVTGEYYWQVKAIDDKGAESGWSVAPGNPAFKIDLSRPSNASNTKMKPYSGSNTEYDYTDPPNWFNRNDLYFSWDPGSDMEGVKGYCLYLGVDQNADPAMQKGVLGTSPISTTGSTCQFITDNISIDFSNASFRGNDWLSSSMNRYFFKIKTIDIANNTFNGPDDSNFISFYFDNTPPQNVTAISAPGSVFSSTSDMYFNWPTAQGHAGSDDHSGILGFQYNVNRRDAGTWIGDILDENTSLFYSLLSKEQPQYLSTDMQQLIELGQNIIYFRLIDRAGNYSELRTAYINYGGEAPKFTEGEVVNVIPSTNTTNLYAFNWLPAIPSEGNTIASYYYMINTNPPASLATIKSNSATYIPITQTSIQEIALPGLRRGANTIHVVAVDNMDNYSPSNFITATFYLNSTNPDPPANLIVSDASIKDASLWRAALVWDFPEYRGTGDLTFHVWRSEDAINWTFLSSTTGLAYVDTVTESKRFYWKVSTTDTSDESKNNPSYSNAVSVIPKGSYTTPPKLTSGPASSSITTTTALITWTTSRTGDSKIAFGLAPGNYFPSETYMSAHVTEHRIQLSNLTPGTTYYYVAKWTDEDGNTGISDEKSFTTEPPPVVKEVRLSNLGISSVSVNFTTIKASKARIYYGITTSFGGIKEIGTSKLETTYTIQLDNLNDGTKYYYRINTYDEEGKEYEGTILDFTTLPRPRVSNIMIQQVINTAQSTLLVSWQSNTKISSVITFYPEANPEQAKDNVDVKLVEGEHKMLIKGLFPDTIYIIKVSGRDIIGNEAVSDSIKVTTARDSRAPLLSSLTVESSNSTQVSGVSQTTSSQLIISWTTDEPSTSQIEFGEGSGSVYNQLTQEDQDLSYNHVVIITGLTPSKVYHFRAISKDSANNVSKSIDTLTITPKATDNAFDLVMTILKESFGFLTE